MLLVTIALGALHPAASRAQEKTSAPTRVCEKKGIPKGLYDKMVLTAFSKLVGQKAGPVAGNYASIKVEEAKASLAGALVFQNGTILGVEAAGGASDGILPLLSGSKPNPSLQVTAEYHILDRRDRTLGYENVSCEAYHAAAEMAWEQYRADSVAAHMNYAETLRLRELERLDDKLKELGKVIDGPPAPDTLNKTTEPKPDSLAAPDTLQITAEPKPDSLAGGVTSVVPTKSALDSLRVEKMRIQRRRNVRSRQSAPSLDRQLDSLEVVRAVRLARAADTVQVTGFSIGWASLGLEANNHTFRLYHPERPPDDRIKKAAYASYSFVLRYQRYKLSSAPGESTFWRVGVRFGLEDNLGGLTKLEVTQRTPLEAAQGELFSEQKFSVVQGDYRNDLGFLRLEADYYRFALARDRVAFHVFPAMEFKDEEEMAVNLGLGLLMSAQDTQKMTSRVNAELFLDLLDLWNNRDAKEGLLARSTLGLRLSFPFTFGNGD